MNKRLLTALAIITASTTALLTTSGAVAAGRPRSPHFYRSTIPLLGDGSAGYSSAFAINNRGQAVGADAVSSAGKVIETRGFLWDRGRLTDLGTLPGRDTIDPRAITDNDWIAGESFQTPAWAGSRVNTTHRVWVWHHGVMTDIPLLAEPIGAGGADYATFAGINSRGQLVGTEFSFGSRSSRPFLWQNGHLTDIGDADGGRALAINDRGQILLQGPSSASLLQGTTRTPIPGNVLELNEAGGVLTAVNVTELDQHLEYWVNGVLHDLGSDAGAAYKSLNNRGQVAFNTSPEASGTDSDNDIGNGYLWRNGVRKRLTTPRGRPILALFINDRGWISGLEYDHPGYSRPVVRLPDGRVVDLFPGLSDDDPDVMDSFPVGPINDRGEVLGHVGHLGTIWHIQP